MEPRIFIGIVVVLGLALGLLSDRQTKKRESRELRQAEDAKLAYRTALALLRQDPTDPARYQTALESGRDFITALDIADKIEAFDAKALDRDLAEAQALAKTPGDVVNERLETLDQLKASGKIDDDEYRATRTRILGEL